MHRKRYRRAEHPRWELTPKKPHVHYDTVTTIDFSRVVESDLVYDDAAVPLILRAFPTAQIIDASDMVHEDRVEVRFQGLNVTKDVWYRFLVESGVFDISLMFVLDQRIFPASMTTWLRSWKTA